MRIEWPVANGLRTDHPVPNLPFLDDSHLPIHEGKAIEAHGRHDYNHGWGRYDRDQGDERRWSAFTNDQFNLVFAWLVRADPGYGRTVQLYASGDETIMYEVSPRDGDPLVHRAGGYWWDGKAWHRPMVIFDHATEQAVVVPVPDAASITAEDYLADNSGRSDKGALADITMFNPAWVSENQWAHDLAFWATQRPDDGLPLQQCVVDVSAPELEREALVSKAGAARLLGLSRAEVNEAMNGHGGGRAARFPFPQRRTPHTGSPRWSKPVLTEWLWERQRAHPEPVVAHLRRGDEHPNADALLHTIEAAALWEMQQSYGPAPHRECSLGLPLESFIGWVITEQPRYAEALFGNIVRSARNQLNLSDATIVQTLRDAAQWGIPGDANEDGALEEFLQRTLPPSALPDRHQPG